MTVVGPLVAYDDGELDERVDRSAGAHRPPVREGRERAAERDLSGRQRDQAALARDRAADVLDARARERDAMSDRLAQVGRRMPVSSGRDLVLRAERDRQRATEDRACAAAERALAAENRVLAAADRLRAAGDREAAIPEPQLVHSAELPGVWTREHGLVALQRDVDRAHRTATTMTAVVIGVELEDSDRVRAHDALLHAVVGALLGCVRSYDLIIRTGDVSFVAAVCGAAIADARARFGAVQEALGGEGIAISVGCAEMVARDDAAGLIDRAGADRRSFGEEDPAPVDAAIGAQPC